jgi:exodeoxyribonuclease V gamma subunit
MAEWLKMALATQAGVCAATRVELPARFLWRAYRQVLGRAAVPALSALDKQPLTWRLMQPAAGAAAPAGLRAAGRLSARGGMHAACSWRSAWPTSTTSTRSTAATGWPPGPTTTTCCPPAGQAWPAAPALPADQRWQAALWRELLLRLGAGQRAPVHAAPCTSALWPRWQRAAGAGRSPCPGAWCCSACQHLPLQTLQALAALSTCTARSCWPCPTPAASTGPTSSTAATCCACSAAATRCAGSATWPRCRWQDHARPRAPAAGRLGPPGARLRAPARRLRRRLRPRCSVLRCRAWTCLTKAPGGTLLQQVQARIRDLVPLAERPKARQRRRGRPLHRLSHRPQRAARGGGPARPVAGAAGRAPAPRAPRCSRATSSSWCPTSRALHRPSARCLARSRALTTRATSPTTLPTCGAPPQPAAGGAGMAAAAAAAALPPERTAGPAGGARPSRRRFGLDAPICRACSNGWPAPACAGACMRHRAAAGPGRLRRQNTWAFGLRRMLLGYASGDFGRTPGAI